MENEEKQLKILITLQKVRILSEGAYKGRKFQVFK